MKTLESKINFFYLRDKDGAPIVCVAMKSFGGNGIRFAISTWNRRDQFNRTMARHVASARLSSGKCLNAVAAAHWHNDLVQGQEQQIKYRIADSIAENHSAPGSARKVAKLAVKRGNATILTKYIGALDKLRGELRKPASDPVNIISGLRQIADAIASENDK